MKLKEDQQISFQLDKIRNHERRANSLLYVSQRKLLYQETFAFRTNEAIYFDEE